MRSKKITVIGAGYVGMSTALLFAKKNQVLIHDIDQKRVNLINKSKASINEDGMNEYIRCNKLNLRASLSLNKSIEDTDYIILALPTNFNDKKNSFETRVLDKTIKKIFESNKKAIIVIKSTVPVGYTENMCKAFHTDKIIFCPEFLREGSALADSLNPSRLIFGGYNKKNLEMFASIMHECCHAKNVKNIFMTSSEAESSKLFSNTYLAMRVAFFNELDTFALSKKMDSKQIIQGVSLDKRIGNFYNNPSFGYGGYCLPKDTKQLLSNFDEVPQKLISSIVSSNKTRFEFIAKKILSYDTSCVGIYRLAMKKDSSNYRDSAIINVIKILLDRSINICIYEPMIESGSFDMNVTIINDIEEFKEKSSIVVTNRISNEIMDIKDKIFSRDIFNKDL
jgi:UDPglucose 6-dehydrogenase